MKKALLAAAVLAMASSAFAHQHDPVSGNLGLSIGGTTTVSASAAVLGQGSSYENAGVDAYSVASIGGTHSGSGATVSANDYSAVTATSFGVKTGNTPKSANGADAVGTFTTTFGSNVDSAVKAVPEFNGFWF